VVDVEKNKIKELERLKKVAEENGYWNMVFYYERKIRELKGEELR
jgi:hypothetical protein